MRKRGRVIMNWVLSLGLTAAASSSPGLAWAKPQNAGPNSAAPASAARSAAPGRARAGSAKVRAQAKKKDAGPCLARPVRVVRSRGEDPEPRDLALTYCDGSPNPGALDSLSVLARPRDVDRPLPAEIRAYQRLPVNRGPKSKRRNPQFVSARVMRVDAGLLSRLQKVAERFPGRVFEVVSGYRPDARNTSRHHHARALDFRVAGVSNERVRDFLRSLEETGVGYYPNSSFVHMDVRDDKAYWVDRSGPGERPDYGTWPAPEDELERTKDDLLKHALADLGALKGSGQAEARPAAYTPPKPIIDPKPSTPPKPIVAPKPYTPPKPIIDPAPSSRSARAKPQREEDQLSAAEVTRIRKDALKALQALR